MTKRKLLAAAAVGLVMATLASGVADAKEWTKVRFGVEGAYPPFSETTPAAS
jgi:ABC-type amino acid transport substrate-binding protein